MKPASDVASLEHEELVVLVQQLRQQVTERDREIETLKHQLAEARRRSKKADQDSFPKQNASSTQQEPLPGSQRDLLTQLEQLYPEGK